MDDQHSGEKPEAQEQELKEHGDKLQEQIDDVREDWERKKDDSAVPGATGDVLTGSEEQPDAGSDEHRLPDGPG